MSGRLLIVEDDGPVVEDLQMLADHMEIPAVVVSKRKGGPTPFDGAMQAADEGVDAALLDYWLNGKNGGDILEEFRTRGFSFPVAFLTGCDPKSPAGQRMSKLVDEGLAEAYIQKDDGPEPVLEWLEKHFGG